MVERLRDGPRVVGDRLERLGAVEVLAAGDEPDFGLLQWSEHVNLRPEDTRTHTRRRYVASG